MAHYLYNVTSSKVKLLLLLLLMILGGGTLLFNQTLLKKFRDIERSSIELWAKSIEFNGTPQHLRTRDDISLLKREILDSRNLENIKKQRWVRILDRIDAELANTGLDFIASELIIKNRFSVPSIVVDEDDNILYHRNIAEANLSADYLETFKIINEPIKIVVGSGELTQTQYVYYGESETIILLRYVPYLQIVLILLFAGLAYYSWSSIRDSEQSNLWVGMAKEAAHQLGTPLSSLLGWIALLKESDISTNVIPIIHELQNDVERLQKVAERFNKIGSRPEKKVQRIGPLLENVSQYMEKRLPRLGINAEIRREIEITSKSMVNVELFEWAIENLVKNALDAIDIKDQGAHIIIRSYPVEDEIYIDIEDNGKGIEKKYYKEVFRPGFSTKKRGWGLGLSLTKRIIEDYHEGSLTIVKSEVGKGTQFRMILKAIRN